MDVLHFHLDKLLAVLYWSIFLHYSYSQIKKALRGIKVEVTHRGNMRRKYRISGLTPQATRELTYGCQHNSISSFSFRNLLIVQPDFFFCEPSFTHLCLFYNLHLYGLNVYNLLEQFPSWWKRHYEVCCAIFSRDLRFSHSTYNLALPASW